MIHPSVKFWNRALCNVSDDADIGEGTVIHTFVTIHDKVKIGKNCKIENGAMLFNGVTLEDNVFIGPGCVLTNDKKLTAPFVISPTLVRSGAKLGANSSILAGVTIGRDAIVGMGSVVLKDVEPGHIVVGNPAKTIKVKQGYHWYE